MSKSKNRYEVIVIGCGAAGVGAARELTSQGINNVLILEGSDRVGGRINTIQTDPSHHVDLGAQWLHGKAGNAVYKFASSRNLLYDFLSLDGEGTFYTENGQVIPETLEEEVIRFLDGVDDEMTEMSSGDTLLSVGDLFRKEFDEYLSSCKQDDPELIQLKKSLFEWYIKWQRVDNSCNKLESISAHCRGSYLFWEGNELMNPKHGFSTIFNAILQETNADVVLSSEVTCIDYASNLKSLGGRFVRSDGLTLPVIVRCKNGEEYEANHVVVTPSVGYLKKHLSMFSPALPDNLQEAIISTGFGTIDKIFLEFDEPFWPDDCEGIQFVWTEQPPIYEITDISECWFQGITGFEPVGHQKAVLYGWIGGAEAEFMEKLPLREVGMKCIDLLKQFLGREDVPYPKKVYRSQWANNSLVCGSYSYHTVPCNCRMGISGGNALNVPVYAKSDCGDKVPVLVLAGEANSIKYYATVHGAMQNGMRQVSHYLKSLYRGDNNASAFKSKI